MTRSRAVPAALLIAVVGLAVAAQPPRPPAAEPPAFDPKDSRWRWVPPDPKLGGPGGWVWDPAGAAPGQPGVKPAGPVLVVGAADGGGPRVRVFRELKEPPAADFFAYDREFRGGVRVAVADVNGDGVPDVVTAPGRGMGPTVRVYDGRDMSLMTEFNGADPAWGGGVHVAACDLTPDGRALVAVAPDVGGGPAVKVFDLAQGKEVASFMALPDALRGGVRLAWGDVDGNKVPDLLVAPGPCDHPPVVRAFSGKDWRLIGEYAAFDPRWHGGVWVAAADRNGRADVVVGMDAGGPPLVRVIDPAGGKVVREWLAFPEEYRGGVRVTARDFDGDGVADVACAAGPGLKGCAVRVFGGKTGRPIAEFAAIPDFDGGVFVGTR